MKRIHSLAAVCGLSLTLSAAMAMPPVLDRVPDNALITLVIPAPQTLQKNMAALATAVEAPGPVPALDDILAMTGMGGGIDTSRSVAVVVIGPKELDGGAAAPKKSKAKKTVTDDGAKTEKADKDGDKDAAKPKDDMGGDKDAAKDGDKADGDKEGGKKKRRHAAEAPAAEDIDWDAGMQRVVIVVPITKYEDFLGNFGVKPAGEGKVDSFVTNQGDDAFSKPLGDGYAVMGEDKELVEAFTGKVGDSPIKVRMGKAGETLADGSDIVAIVNVERLRPIAKDAMANMEKQARAQMEMMGQQGMDKNLDMAKWMGETIVRDTQMIVAGVKTGSMGVSVDIVGAFKPDSYLAKVFGKEGNASPLLGKVFGGKYLLAGALDLSGAGAKQFMKDIISKTDIPGGEKAAATALSTIDNTDGQAVVVGSPEGGVFSGILTATMMFTAAKDPQLALKNFKASLAALDGAKVGDMTYATKYTEPSGKEDESHFASWETKMQSESGEMPAQLAQAMPMLFGPAGVPSGYVAVANGGLYTLYSKNTELMNKAIGSVKEGNAGSDAMLKQTQAMLPKGRMAEVYFGTRNIMDIGLPFLAMATGGGLPMDKIPEKLPPIAGCVAAQDGSMRLSLVVPAPIIKTGISLAEAMQEAKAGGPKANDKGGAKPDKGAGQPKF